MCDPGAPLQRRGAGVSVLYEVQEETSSRAHSDSWDPKFGGVPHWEGGIVDPYYGSLETPVIALILALEPDVHRKAIDVLSLQLRVARVV
jgi:hypothetical protein